MPLSNLNALRMFDASARHLNFRLAAEELHLTQGAVAQQVRKLEATLEVKLFHRHARGLSLTEAGTAYHGPIRRALALIDAATATLRPRARRIRLSAPPSLTAKWLLPRIANFNTAHPDIELEIEASDRVANFQSDGVDVAIRHAPLPRNAALRTEVLAPEAPVAVATPALADQIGRVRGAEDFAHWPLLQDAHKLWSIAFASAGLPAPRQLRQFNQTALTIDAALAGQGVTIAPRMMITDDLKAGRLQALWAFPAESEALIYSVCPLATLDQDRAALLRWLADQTRAFRT